MVYYLYTAPHAEFCQYIIKTVSLCTGMHRVMTYCGVFRLLWYTGTVHKHAISIVCQIGECQKYNV